MLTLSPSPCSSTPRLLHIVPHTGVDRVLLGMDRTEARLILGEPDSVQLLDVDPVTADSIIWCYDDPDVEFAFDEDTQFSVCEMQEFTVEQLDISFWTRHGRVVSVTLFPRYVVDDSIPIWPEFR